MQIVMVEFAVGAERVESCVKAVEGITRSLVARQPEFHGAVIHREEVAGTVWNIMRWDTHQAFVDFRDGNAEQIGAVLGEFGPKGHMLDISASVDSEQNR